MSFSPFFQILMSEDYGELLNKLKAELYSSSRKFTRKLIITPCDSLKKKIEKNVLEDGNLGIFWGVESLNLHLAMQHLLELFFPLVRFPTLAQISFLLEKYLQEAVQKNDPLFADVFEYIQSGEERKFKLCSDLSALFFEYSLFLDERFLKEEGWQQKLFTSVFEHFDLPFRVFKQPLPPLKTPACYQVFLFGISSIPKLYMEFLENISKISGQIEVHFYCLSYSPHYFGDYLSSKERKKKSLEELEFVSEQNPLFASLCMLAKPFLNWIIDKDYPVQELYQGKEATSLLAQIQWDLFELVNPLDMVKIEKSLLDSSLFLLEASSKLREVEAVRDEILYKIETEGIPPGKIAVFAPDIDVYVPYIEYVFGSENCPVGYFISSVKKGKESPFLFLLQGILTLFDSRWDLEEVIDLLESTIIAEKFGFSKGDVERFTRYLEKTGMSWGFNLMHRRAFIQGDVAISLEGTLQNSFTKICLGLCMSQTEEINPLFYSPLEIDMPMGEKALAIIEFLNSLYFEIQKLKEAKKNLRESFKALAHFFETFVAPPYTMQEERRAFEEFEKDFCRLFQSLDFVKEENLPLPSFLFSLKEMLSSCKRHKASLGNKVRIRFEHLSLGTSLGEDLIVCMGLSQSAFPKNHQRKEFDLLWKKERAPSSYERDRYAFLEMIMSAKSGLILSYSKKGEGGEEEEPSYLLTDLLSYLKERGIEEGDLPLQKIPEFPFSCEALEKCYDPLYLAIAQKRNVSPDHSPKISMGIPKELSVKHPTPQTLDIAELFHFAKNPLHYFYKHHFDSFLLKEKGEQKWEKEFLLTPLDLGLMRFKWPQNGKEVLERAYTINRPLFNSLYQKSTSLEVAQELGDLEETLRQFSLLKSDFFSVHFTPFASKMEEVAPKIWEHPPISLKLPLGNSLLLVGELPLVTAKGLVAMKKATFEDLYSLWPSLLIFHQLEGERGKDLFLLRDGKKKGKVIEGALNALSAFTQLALYGKEKPLFTLPSLMESLFKSDEKKFFEKLQEENDPYVRWLLGSLEEKSYDSHFTSLISEIKEPLAPFLTWLENA